MHAPRIPLDKQAPWALAELAIRAIKPHQSKICSAVPDYYSNHKVLANSCHCQIRLKGPTPSNLH